ncbi:MAG: NAD-dependent epimerase/dehydratase family protein [Thermoleophilia bacterium]
MKILITGGAGFIGSHTAELFVNEGHDVTVVDDFSSSSKSNLDSVADKIKLIEQDIRDTTALSRACKNSDVILHLAAVSSVEKSIEEPLTTHEVNTGGCLSVMEAARKNKVRRVIFSSSAAVYGNDPELPKTESSPVLPLSPYAWHKLTGEFYGRNYRELYGIDFLALRYFNVYGARQDPASPYSGVLTIFMNRAAGNEPITIFGDGSQTRDFIHVSDIASVNLLAAGAAGPLPGIINVSRGIETSILEMAELIRKTTGSSSEIVFREARKGDIRRSLASNSLLESALGYRPRVSIEAGLKTLVAG